MESYLLVLSVGLNLRIPLKETTSWMVSKGHSISHSLPIEPASLDPAALAKASRWSLRWFAGAGAPSAWNTSDRRSRITKSSHWHIDGFRVPEGHMSKLTNVSGDQLASLDLAGIELHVLASSSEFANMRHHCKLDKVCQYSMLFLRLQAGHTPAPKLHPTKSASQCGSAQHPPPQKRPHAHGVSPRCGGPTPVPTSKTNSLVPRTGSDATELRFGIYNQKTAHGSLKHLVSERQGPGKKTASGQVPVGQPSIWRLT